MKRVVDGWVMNEVEITDIPPLKPGERTLLDMHSVLNVFNVLRGELTLMGLVLANDDHLLRAPVRVCDDWIASLRDPARIVAVARDVEVLIQQIHSGIDAVLDATDGARANPEIAESLSNIESVFAILRVRARELLARVQSPEAWVEFSLPELRANFAAVFAAIEKNSHGRYRILHNAALKEEPDYYVDFKLESVDGDVVWMPAVFQDVMRDLIANARKYTQPGGHITAALHESETELRFCVEDTGMGIPAAEIPGVVAFGHRASNVGNVRTMGGGFGLTKAFLATKQFGGRFFIASEQGVGTRMRVIIPRPVTARSPGTERTLASAAA